MPIQPMFLPSNWNNHGVHKKPSAMLTICEAPSGTVNCALYGSRGNRRSHTGCNVETNPRSMIPAIPCGNYCRA